MTIATIVPNNYFAPWDFVKSILSLPPKYNYYAIEGPSLPDNRNKVFAYAKKVGGHLLFIDSDIVFKSYDVAKLEGYLEAGFDAVTGVYPLGRSPYPPAIFKRVKDDFKLIEPEEGFHPIGACGAGFLAISERAIKKLPDNPFSNVWEGNIQHGEDVSFCYQLMQCGLKLFCDSTVKVGQIRTMVKFA